MAETTGNRLYLIRLACGDGVRRAETLDAFVERVKKRTGAEYLASTISLLERMKQKWKLDDIHTLAAVDPEQRGPAWLAFGAQTEPILLDPRKDRGLTEAEEARALTKAAELAAQRKRAGKAGRRRA